MLKYEAYTEDEKQYFIFTSFINGMNLFSFLRELKYVMEIKTARFYVA